MFFVQYSEDLFFGPKGFCWKHYKPLNIYIWLVTLASSYKSSGIVEWMKPKLLVDPHDSRWILKRDKPDMKREGDKEKAVTICWKCCQKLLHSAAVLAETLETVLFFYLSLTYLSISCNWIWLIVWGFAWQNKMGQGFSLFLQIYLFFFRFGLNRDPELVASLQAFLVHLSPPATRPNGFCLSFLLFHLDSFSFCVTVSFMLSEVMVFTCRG